MLEIIYASLHTPASQRAPECFHETVIADLAKAELLMVPRTLAMGCQAIKIKRARLTKLHSGWNRI